MKQTKRLGIVTISTLLTLSLALMPTKLLATSQMGATCPQKYIATVTNVEDVPAATFPKVEVAFQIIQTLKGDSAIYKKIQIVKDGPIQFKSGEIYTVESRENWLCAATLFSKI